MRHSQIVFARDRQSLEEVRSMVRGQDDKLALSYDMAFLLEPFPPAGELPAWVARDTQERPLVGLNVSGLLYHGGYSQDNMFGLKANYKETVRELIRFFIEEKGTDVLLVPHVYGAEGDVDADTETCQLLRQELDARYGLRLQCVEEEYDQHEIKYLIGRCNFFLGSRMHACIAALSQCVPALGLAYSKKFAGVLGTIGVEHLVIDLRDSDLSQIRLQVDAAYTSREQSRAELMARMPVVKQTVANLFKKIAV